MGNNILIDKTVFSSSLKNELITSQIKSLLSQKHWSLSNFIVNKASGKYNNLRMKQLFMYMRGTQVQTVHFWERNHNNILWDFCHIKFTHLKILILQNNNITNIEALSWAEIPNLQGVSLNENKICSIYSLKKWQSKTLKSISFKQNSISQFELCRTGMGQQIQSSQMILDPSNATVKPIIINDISGLVKTNIKNLVHLSIGNHKRILQDKLQDRLQQIWNNLTIINSNSTR